MKTVNSIVYIGSDSDSIIPTYIQDTQPTGAVNGALWIDISTNPPRTKRYDGHQWKSVQSLDLNVYADVNQPSDPYEGLVWIKTDTLDLYVYVDGTWRPVHGGSTPSGSVIYRGDDKTIRVVGNTISVEFNNDEKDKPGYVWDNKRIQKEALIKAIIFG